MTERLSTGVVGLALAAFVPGAAVASQAQGTGDTQLQNDVHKALDNKRFKDVTASVHDDGMVILAGTVDLYADKEAADSKVHHVHHVKAVQNEIQVAGATTDDTTLRNKLAQGLAYDRVGYGTTAFNSINIGVQNGVVTLSGTVYGPSDKDSALSLVTNTKGVKDVIDNIEVAPVSPMDDSLRRQLAQAIYGSPQLSRYAINPEKPIRITVVNGNVTLTGVVDSKADSDVANIRANSVPGVFKVVNNLQVAGQQAGR